MPRYTRPTLGALPVQGIVQGVSSWLGNVFGANNRPAIEDIKAGLEMGQTISPESWAMAGLPADGGDWYRNWKLQHGIITPDMALNAPGMISGALGGAGGFSLSNPLVIGGLVLGAILLLRK